jgi:RNA polymerase sigma-70 factor (ECF subfamily)
MSNAEIGEVMGRSEGAIKSLYHRTLLSLREMFDVEAQSQDKERKALEHQTKEIS